MAEAFMGYVLPWGNMSLLGRAGDREPVRHHSRHRPGTWWTGSAATTASSDATLEPLLRAARGGACRWCCCCSSALHLRGAARSRLEQPRRHRDQGARRARTASRSTAFRSIPTTRSKDRVRGRRVPRSCFAIVVFFVPTLGGLFLEAPNFEPGQSRCRRRSTSRRCGTSRRSTRSCARCPTSAWGIA